MAPLNANRESGEEDGSVHPLRLLIACEVRVLCEGLAKALARQRRLQVVGKISTEDVLQHVRTLRPDIVLLDASLSVRPDVVRQIVALPSEVRVVAIAVREDEEQVLALAEAGVSGYASRNASMKELVEIISQVGRGEFRFTPHTAKAILRRLAKLADTEARSGDAHSLTYRERQIVTLIDRGFSNKEIAQQLCIGTATVKNHVHAVLDKLHVRRRGEAAALMRAADSKQLRAQAHRET